MQNPPKGNIFISTILIPNEELLSDNRQRKGKSDLVRITIQDDGPGFPPNFPIFEPFHTTDPNSTGLGMATVKELVEAHGGSIKVLPSEGVHIQMEIPL
jgi:signal transduction histidine kinase